MTTVTYLQKGDVIDMGSDGICVVEMVNDCRARVRPTRKVYVEFEPSTTGEKVAFNRPCGAFNISPNSEVTILRHARKKKLRPKVRSV